MGCAGTLIVHVLVLTPFLWGTGRAKHVHPDDEGAPSSGAPAMTMLLLDATREQSDSADDQKTAAGVIAPATFLIPVGDVHIGLHPVLFDPNPEPDESSPTNNDDAPGDQAGRAALFGRYMGQITARISRAWSRPRTPIGAEHFSCWVQVEQDNRGVVHEITLTQCNGTPAWQLSLVHAIESASPLPAPSDPTVFAKTLHFQLESDGFTSANSSDGFEPAPALSSTVAANAEASSALQTFINQIHSKASGSGAIDLRLDGTASAP